ncbi:MAG: AraC family transcriptional regulator [Sphingobacteriales bacterium]|nr:MAG: AraC family transcriptional regulator [Sphingobacteriales bacterium]
MGQNLKASYSIEELAIVAGMNRTKLQQGFKNLYNKTIYTFLLDLKMAEAKTLLTKENTLSLKEIAALVGYKHVNHFSAAFKKKYEMSPAYFKKVIQCFFPFVLFWC